MISVLFDQSHWNPADSPQTWGDPEALAQQQFWIVFKPAPDGCPKIRRVFMMREFLGLETPDARVESDHSQLPRHSAPRPHGTSVSVWNSAGSSRSIPYVDLPPVTFNFI